MDPTGNGPLMSSPPASDGSSSLKMAQSLRRAMREDFDTAVGVHFKPISGDTYRKSIDATWRWLDKKSLI